MAKVLITDTYLYNIAAAIRSKLSCTDTYTPDKMAGAINQIEVGSVGNITSSDDGNGNVILSLPSGISFNDDGNGNTTIK